MPLFAILMSKSKSCLICFRRLFFRWSVCPTTTTVVFEVHSFLHHSHRRSQEPLVIPFSCFRQHVSFFAQLFFEG